MRGTLLTSIAVAGILSGGMLGQGPEAATLTGRSVAHVAATTSALVQHVTNVCGNNGCVRVQTQRVRHQKPGSVAGNHI
jgi:ribosomal protein L35AE/L33A